jgi:hypothetical protein
VLPAFDHYKGEPVWSGLKPEIIIHTAMRVSLKANACMGCQCAVAHFPGVQGGVTCIVHLAAVFVHPSARAYVDACAAAAALL